MGCMHHFMMKHKVTVTVQKTSEDPLRRRFLVKISDDTVLLPLLDRPETDPGSALPILFNGVLRTVSKRKEMIVDFRVNTGRSVTQDEDV